MQKKNSEKNNFMEMQIIELEKKMLHLEKFIDELNEVVIYQQKQIDRQDMLIKVLQEKSKSFIREGEARIEDEKPPHY